MSFATKGYVATKVSAAEDRLKVLITSGTTYKGTWNADTNTPTLTQGSGTNGWFYEVSKDGTWSSIYFNVGDKIIYNGKTSKWERIATGVEEDDSPMILAYVSENTAHLPATRRSGKTLIVGDYVAVDSNSNIPFEIDGLIFDSLKDIAIWNGTRYQISSYSIAKSNEMDLYSKLNESLSGLSQNQSEVNIENVLAINKLAIIAAPEYKDTLTYNVGDYVTKNFILYKCNTNITTPETWNVSHWTVVNIVSELLKINKIDNLTIIRNLEGKLSVGDSSIGENKITSNAVTTSKIKDGNVTKSKIDTEAKVVYEEDTQTIKNKTINADDNTINNLETDNFKEGIILKDTDDLTNDNNHLVASSKIKKITDDLKENLANYRGSFATKAALLAYTGDKSNNDYAVVQEDEDHNEQVTRYIYVSSTSSWVFQYVVNNKAFTQAQQDAIDSTATITKINQIETNKTDIAELKSRKVGSNTLATDISAQQLDNDIKEITNEYKNKTINADDNAISNLETDNFKDSAKSTTIPATGSVDTKFVTEKAVDDYVKDQNIEMKNKTFNFSNGTVLKNTGFKGNRIVTWKTDSSGNIIPEEEVISPIISSFTITPESITEGTSSVITVKVTAKKTDKDLSNVHIQYGSAEKVVEIESEVEKVITFSISSGCLVKCWVTDSDGNTSDIKEKYISSITPTIYGYFGTVKNGVESHSITSKEYTGNGTLSNDGFVYKYPASYGDLTLITANGDDVTSLFTKSTEDISGVSYNVYSQTASYNGVFSIKFI